MSMLAEVIRHLPCFDSPVQLNVFHGSIRVGGAWMCVHVGMCRLAGGRPFFDMHTRGIS